MNNKELKQRLSKLQSRTWNLQEDISILISDIERDLLLEEKENEANL